jgi:hypothetical protein
VVKGKIPSPYQESNPRTLIVQPVKVKIKVKSLCFLNEHHAMEAYWGVDV